MIPKIIAINKIFTTLNSNIVSLIRPDIETKKIKAIVKTNPEIDLYTSDKRHPSKAGTYLSACMIFASIFQSSPVGNNFIFDLDKEVAMNLQKNAWNTYKKYYKK